MKQLLCLNKSEPNNRRFIETYGLAKTYQIYAQHNFWMPSFDSYQNQKESDVLPTEQAYQLLNTLVNLDLFKMDSIESIPALVPQTTEAAFWKDVFYFGKDITRGALSEEVFHAVFQRLIPLNEQEALYKTGQALLKSQLKALGFSSIKEYYQYQLKTLPETYSILSEQDGYNRLYEEALAQDYVRHTVYGTPKQARLDLESRLKPFLGQKVARFVQQLIDTLYKGLDKLRSLYKANEFYATTFYNKINQGEYKTARIVDSNPQTAAPSTRLITLADDTKVHQRESEQLIRNISGLALQLKNRDETSDLSEQQRIQIAIEAFSKQYLDQAVAIKEKYKGTSVNGTVLAKQYRLIAGALSPTRRNAQDFKVLEDNPEYSAITADVKEYLVNSQVVTNLQDELDEDEFGARMQEFSGYGKEANELGGYNGLSASIKQYIALTGKHRQIDGVLQYHKIKTGGVEFELPIIDIVNTNQVYYGLVRAVSNTVDLNERLKKLLIYTSFDDTDATGAFADQLLKDMAPITYKAKPELDSLIKELGLTETPESPLQLAFALQAANPELAKKEAYKEAKTYFTKLQETNTGRIKEELFYHIDNNSLGTYLSSASKQLLVRTLKGFDLWKRENINMRIDPVRGLSVSSNANTNRAGKDLLEKWKANYNGLSNKANTEIPDAWLNDFFLPKTNSTKLTAEQDAFNSLDDLEKKQQFTQAVQAESKKFKALFSQAGIKLSDAYVQYVLTTEAVRQYPQWAPTIEATPSGKLIGMFDIPKQYQFTSVDVKLIKEYNGQAQYSPFAITDNKEALKLGRLSGMLSSIKNIAEGNALFDETATESSYVNANDKVIYSFQKKTYSLDMFTWFTDSSLSKLSNLYKTGQRTLLRYNNGEAIYLKEDAWALQENHLLKKLFSDSFYQENKHLFTAFSVDGLQQTHLTRNEKDVTTSKAGATALTGTTFGDLSPREFDLFNLNSFVGPTATIVKGKRIAPVFLGNREASKTGEYLNVPVLENVIKEGKLTDAGSTLFLDEIKKEYDRIRNVYKSLIITDFVDKGITYGKTTPTFDSTDVLTNYNTGKALLKKTVDYKGVSVEIYVPTNSKDYRGLQFSDTLIGLLGNTQAIPGLNTGIENLVVQAALDIEFDYEAHKDVLQKSVSDIIYQHKARYAKHGLWNLTRDEPTKVLDRKMTKELLETKLVSDFLNGVAIGQIEYGDAALLYKNDGIDNAKRAKGFNAAIQSFAVPFAAPELSIDKAPQYFNIVTTAEPTANSDVTGNSVDIADAQGHDTIHSRRISLYAQGKLTTQVSNILDKIDKGEPRTKADIDNLNAAGVMLNSEKTVGDDGQQYKKLSVSVLTKEVTSEPELISEEEFYRNATIDKYNRIKLKKDGIEVSTYGGNYYRWVPIIGRENLHAKRLRMEGFKYVDGNWVFDSVDARIDLVTPLTASKTLNANVHTKLTDKQTVDWTSIEDKNVNLFDLNYYGLQSETPSGHEHIVDPTQMVEIIANELGPDAQFWFKDQFLDKNKTELLWQEYLTSRDRINYNVADKLFEDAAGNLDLKRYLQKAFETVVKTGTDKQTAQLFDPASGYNLNLPLTRDKFISLFFTHFSKGVLSHSRAGDSLAHVSSLDYSLVKKVYRNEAGYLTWDTIRTGSDEYKALKRQGALDNLTNLRDARYKHEYQTNTDNSKQRVEPEFYLDSKGNKVDSWFTQAKTLLASSPTMSTTSLSNTMTPVVYVLDSLRHAKPRWETVNKQLVETGYFDEALMPVHDLRISNIDKSLRYSFGVRIPSQDKHSAVNVEWVDTLPEYMGSSIVLTKEIIELSGSDFDIDKLYQTRTEGYWTGDVFTPYGTAETTMGKWEEFTKYALANYPSIKKELKKILLEPEFKDVKAELEKVTQTLTDLTDDEAWAEYTSGTLEQRKQDLNKSYQKAVGRALSFFGFPATFDEFNKLNYRSQNTLNVGATHNKMLALQQSMLANSTTLDDTDPNGGQYNQPASLDKYNNIQDSKENGVNLFGDTSNRAASWWPMVHSQIHEKNQIGKALIGVSVNANLFMINAVKFQFSVDPSFRMAFNDGKLHDGLYKEKQYYSDGSPVLDASGLPVRVFDIISTITTANTDEAKEGKNAFFKLNGDAQSVVIHMVGQGYSLEDSLIFVNQPVVQQFTQLRQQAKNVKANTGIVIPSEKILGTLSDDQIAKKILKLGVDDSISTREYTTKELRVALAYSKATKEQQTAFTAAPNTKTLNEAVLADFIRMLRVSDYAGNLVKFIKLKKGFGQDLAAFDGLVRASKNLQFGKDGEFPIDIYEKLDSNPKKAAQYLQLINDLVPQSDKRQREVLFRRSPFFDFFKDKLSVVFKAFGAEKKELLDKAIETFTFTTLHQEQSTSTPLELNSVYVDGAEARISEKLNNFKAQYAYTRINETTGEVEKGPFADNSLFSLLQSEDRQEIAAINLNTIGKLRPEQQEELLDSFQDLYTRQVLTTIDGVEGYYLLGKGLADELVNYYIVKDGWQFTMKSISKLFGPSIFTSVSNRLTSIFKGSGFDINGGAAKLANALGRDITYQPLIERIKPPKTTSELYSLFEDNEVLYYENLQGVRQDKVSNQVVITIPVLNKEDSFRVATGLRIKIEKNIGTFPKFIVMEQEVYDEDSDENTLKPFTYELASLITPNGQQYTPSDLQNSTSYKGTRARYVQVVHAGTKNVSSANALGDHYTEANKSLLNKHVQLSTGAAKVYYTMLSQTKTNPVSAIETVVPTTSIDDSFDPFEQTYEADVEDISYYEEESTLLENDLYSVDNQVDVSYISGMNTTENTTESTQTSTNPKDYTNHTGGAKLSDAAWDIIGREFGVVNHKHYREPGTTEVDSLELRKAGVKATELDTAIYDEGQPKATIAARQMGRIESNHQVRSNYMIRNWAQVKYADAVYALGTIIPKGAIMDHGKKALIDQVKGGTGYAVQMAINENKPVYIYDGTKDSWFTWSGRDFIKVPTPALTKNFAGIGSRTLSTQEVIDKSLQAIRDVYTKTFKSEVNPVQESISTVVEYNYYGQILKVTLDNSGLAVDVDIKQSASETNIKYQERKQKILDAYNNNGGLNPQIATKPLEQPTEELIESKTGFTFTHKGKTIDTAFQLTAGQEQALKGLIDFALGDTNEDFITLQGPGGSGKTALIGYLEKYLNRHNFVYSAPTHAASVELAFATAKTGNTKLPLTTTSSWGASFDNRTGKSTVQIRKKMAERLKNSNNILVIDEVSMLSPAEYDNLKEVVKAKDIKVVFMGDPVQIPAVNVKNPVTKEVSKAFTEPNQLKLTEVKRTSNTDILTVLGRLRTVVDSRILKLAEHNDKLNYVAGREWDKAIGRVFSEDPLNTVMLSYTNAGAKAWNIKIRDLFEREGDLKKDDIVVGYAGYNSKQVDRNDIGNSMLYKIDNVTKDGSLYKLVTSSAKLDKLIELGINLESNKGYGTYYQLSTQDAFTFSELTQADFDKNNQLLSNVFRDLHETKQKAIRKEIYWETYDTKETTVQDFFRRALTGNDYIFDPAQDKVVPFVKTLKYHKDLKEKNSHLFIGKSIDFGHAITIHKSQGTSIPKVFFDTDTLPREDSSLLIQNGIQIGSEKQSLSYVGLSRVSDSLYINSTNPIHFVNEVDAQNTPPPRRTFTDLYDPESEYIPTDLSNNGISPEDLFGDQSSDDFKLDQPCA